MQHSALTSSVSRESSDRNSSSIPALSAAAAAVGSELSDVQSPRRRFPRVSASPRCPATIPEHPDEELWVDGPRSSVCFAPASSESVSHIQTGCADKFANQSPSAFSSHRVAKPSTPNAELWVDGPAEFRTQVHDGVSDSKAVANSGPAAVARKPVINGEAEQAATSSRVGLPRRSSHGEAVSKSRLPRTSAKKNHSSPRLRRTTPPALDGRITAWMKSVQQASQPGDTVNVTESHELQETESVHLEDHESHRDVDVQDTDETTSMANSSHSLYEHQVDESLETASLCGCAVMSSDDDTASVSKCKVQRLHDGVPDGCVDDKPYTEQQTAVTKDNIPVLSTEENVSKTPVVSSSGTSRRSRVMGPVVRSASNCSRCGSSSPASHRSSSFSHRCISSPRKNSSSHGSPSPEPSRLKLSSTTKTSTPTSLRRCSDAVRERSQPSAVKKPTSAVAEQEKILTNVSSQKSQKAMNEKSLQSKSGASRSVDRCHAGVGKSSPRPATVDGKTCLPVRTKKTSEAGEGPCLVSPYHTVTSPRRRGAGCSTSSDNSSLLSDAVTARSKSSEVELSSGYESMLRDDSDETITAHSADWTSGDNSAHGQCTHNVDNSYASS